ncbi:hypothetical protein [Nocardia africana]
MAELIAAPSGVGHPPQSWMRRSSSRGPRPRSSSGSRTLARTVRQGSRLSLLTDDSAAHRDLERISLAKAVWATGFWSCGPVRVSGTTSRAMGIHGVRSGVGTMRAALVTHIEQRAADLGIELPIPAETLVFIVVALSNGLAIEEIADPGVVPRDLMARTLQSLRQIP